MTLQPKLTPLYAKSFTSSKKARESNCLENRLLQIVDVAVLMFFKKIKDELTVIPTDDTVLRGTSIVFHSLQKQSNITCTWRPLGWSKLRSWSKRNSGSPALEKQVETCVWLLCPFTHKNLSICLSWDHHHDKKLVWTCVVHSVLITFWRSLMNIPGIQR